MTKKQQKAWLSNLLRFTAPILGLFFYQLSQGVELKEAIGIAIFAFYGAISDLIKKMYEA